MALMVPAEVSAEMDAAGDIVYDPPVKNASNQIIQQVWRSAIAGKQVTVTLNPGGGGGMVSALVEDI